MITRIRLRSLLMVAAQAAMAGSQFIVVLLAARFQGPSAVGAFALAVAVITPLQTVLNLGLRQVLMHDTQLSFKIEEYVQVRGLTGLVLILFTCLIAALQPAHVAIVMVLVALIRAFEFISDLAYGSLQTRENEVKVLWSIAVRTGGSVVSMLVVFLGGGDLIGALCCYLAVTAMSVLLIDLPSFDSEVAKFLQVRWRRIWSLAGRGIPLGIAAALNALAANAPRYLLQAHSGEHELGILTAQLYIGFVGSVISLGFGQSLVPQFTKAWVVGSEEVLRQVGRACLSVGLLGLAMCSAAALFGHLIIVIIYGEAFWGGELILILALGGSALTYQMNVLSFAAMSSRAYRATMVGNVAGTLVVFVCGYFLVQKYGLVGAAMTQFLFGAVFCAANLSVLLHALRKRS